MEEHVHLKNQKMNSPKDLFLISLLNLSQNSAVSEYFATFGINMADKNYQIMIPYLVTNFTQTSS